MREKSQTSASRVRLLAGQRKRSKIHYHFISSKRGFWRFLCERLCASTPASKEVEEGQSLGQGQPPVIISGSSEGSDHEGKWLHQVVQYGGIFFFFIAVDISICVEAYKKACVSPPCQRIEGEHAITHQLIASHSHGSVKKSKLKYHSEWNNIHCLQKVLISLDLFHI